MAQFSTITLLDGRTLTCYERISAPEEQPLSRERQRQQEHFFYAHYHFLFSQREHILSDSRMYFTPIPVYSGTAISGPVPNPTLGGLIEWQLHCPDAIQTDPQGKLWLLCKMGWSGLSGGHICTSVNGDGQTRQHRISDISNAFFSYVRINKRYGEAKSLSQSYTLEQVVALLQFKQLVPGRQKY